MYAVMVDPEDDAPLRPGRPQDAQKASRWGPHCSRNSVFPHAEPFAQQLPAGLFEANPTWPCALSWQFLCRPAAEMPVLMHAVQSSSMRAALHKQACTASAPEASRLQHLPDVKVATSAVSAATSMHGTAVGMVPYAAV